MSRSNLLVIFRLVIGTDTSYNNLKNTTMLSLSVYQSSSSSIYLEVNLKVKIESKYLNALIKQANDIVQFKNTFANKKQYSSL